MLQIQKAYPEIKNLTRAEFDKISAEVVEQLNSGKPVTAHRQLYDKTLIFLKCLAKFYEKSCLDDSSFIDNLSLYQLSIMWYIQSRVDNNQWFLNFEEFKTHTRLEARYYRNKNILETKRYNIKFKSLVNENVDDLIEKYYNEEIKKVDIKELKTIKENSFSVLSAREIDVLENCFGLNNKHKSKSELAIIYKVSRERIRQIMVSALKKIFDNKKFCKEVAGFEQ